MVGAPACTSRHPAIITPLPPNTRTQRLTSQTDVFLMLYDVSDAASFEALTETWIPMVDHYKDTYSYVALVGLKSDRRFHPDAAVREACVDPAAAAAMGAEIGALLVDECSALDGDGVFDLHGRVTDAFVKAEARRRAGIRQKKCVVS